MNRKAVAAGAGIERLVAEVQVKRLVNSPFDGQRDVLRWLRFQPLAPQFLVRNMSNALTFYEERLGFERDLSSMKIFMRSVPSSSRRSGRTGSLR